MLLLFPKNFFASNRGPHYFVKHIFRQTFSTLRLGSNTCMCLHLGDTTLGFQKKFRYPVLGWIVPNWAENKRQMAALVSHLPLGCTSRELNNSVLRVQPWRPSDQPKPSSFRRLSTSLTPWMGSRGVL